MRTKCIKLGTLLTPLSRMRPWKLASETAAVDNLSDGRLILSVGLGAVDTVFELFGEVTDRKTRSELLDEGLDILTGLWHGQPFAYQGQHYQIEPCEFLPPPPPVQQPRIPIWVVGAWPRPKSMRRAMQHDGLLPNVMDATGHIKMTPAHIAEMKTYIVANRPQTTPFDIIVEGKTPGDNFDEAVSIVAPWVEAGATWWIEALWDLMEEPQKVRQRLQLGPPGRN